MKKWAKRGFSLLLCCLLLWGCSAGDEKDQKIQENLPLSGKKFAYILYVTPTDIFDLAANGARETAEALGASCDVFFTDLDNTRFQDTVMTCVNQGYDAIYLSHGNQESALDLVKQIREHGIPVCCFDMKFVDENGNSADGSLDGVTQMFQDDGKMTRMLLDYILSINEEKVSKGEPVNILKVWRGPGIAVFDRRQEAYAEYEADGRIRTVETIGPADPKNGELSMIDVTGATLPKYQEGEIDAIWSVYDAYGRGVYTALKEAGRTDIPMVSVDISNQDINFMRETPPVWQASACVDFTTIGQQGIRILAMMLMGEQTEPVYQMKPSLVTWDQLTEESNVVNLGSTIDGYGVNNDHISDWMAPYLAKK